MKLKKRKDPLLAYFVPKKEGKVKKNKGKKRSSLLH